MKQTAVEWLVEILKGQKDIPFTFDEWLIAFEHAKEMEKEQMKALYSMWIVDKKTMELYDFDKYYNETFKSE